MLEAGTRKGARGSAVRARPRGILETPGPGQPLVPAGCLQQRKLWGRLVGRLWAHTRGHGGGRRGLPELVGACCFGERGRHCLLEKHTSVEGEGRPASDSPPSVLEVRPRPQLTSTHQGPAGTLWERPAAPGSGQTL